MGISPTTLTPCAVQVEDGHRRDAQHQGNQARRQGREEAFDQENDGKGGDAHRQRPRLHLRQVAEQRPQLLKEVALRRGEPQQLGNLADGNDQRQAEDKAGDDRLGEEVRDEAQAGDAGEEQDDADGEGKRGGERQVPGGICPGHGRDHGSGHDRHGRAGRHLELAAGGENGVAQHGGEGGVQAIFGREPRHLRVGHGHGDHHAPDGQARDGIGTQGSHVSTRAARLRWARSA